jgi:hypothetical protein
MNSHQNNYLNTFGRLERYLMLLRIIKSLIGGTSFRTKR